MIEIKTFKDLPKYGEYVLVYGKDEKQYGLQGFHVCEMNDLEDGEEFRENGNFKWLTESGREITDVNYWTFLPKEPN